MREVVRLRVSLTLLLLPESVVRRVPMAEPFDLEAELPVLLPEPKRVPRRVPATLPELRL